MAGARSCTDFCPPEWTEHWREWHRGHRCDKDPAWFYIRCDDQFGYDGSILWWGPERRGYTTNLDAAGLYYEDEARRIEGLRGTDRAVQRDIAHGVSHVVRLVSPSRLTGLSHLPATLTLDPPADPPETGKRG